MADTARGVTTHEMDTNVFFEKFTVDEIRDIEKKTRADIERKKEDLRQMVGERYRDLIEAADTITDMKTCAENVMGSIARMQGLCQNLKQMPTLRSHHKSTLRKDVKKPTPDSHSYGLAMQIKLLHDMPEKIWSALDNRAYLLATRLFLLARHVNTSLQLDSQHSARVLTRFPVLTTQWAAIGHFKATILQSCRDTLKEADIPNQMAAECLCSILLLEDSTPRQVFNELLLLRTTAVQQLFQTDHSHVSIKRQIHDTVSLIITTVRQIYAVFYRPDQGSEKLDESDLLMSTLQAVTSKGEEGAILEVEEGSVSSKYMPTSATAFRPVLRNHATPISSTHLQQNCHQWVQTCANSVRTGLEKLLNFITTVKGLGSIRDDIWESLNQDNEMSKWPQTCDSVLGHQMSPWEELFQKLFMDRTMALIQSQFDSAVNTVKQQISRVLTDLGSNREKYIDVERNLSQYIWSESASDIPANSAWLSASQKSLQDAGPLLMKAKAHTPAVQSLCQNFDVKLRALLDDSAFYLKPSSSEPVSDRGPFNKFADDEVLQKYIQTMCDATMQKLLDHLGRELYGCKQQLSGCQDHASQAVIIDRVLLLARLSCALGELTPHLQHCMTDSAERQKQDSARFKRQTSKTTAKTNADNTQWMKLSCRLQEFSQEAYSCWTGHMTECYQRQFMEALLDKSGQAILLATTRWDEIEIKEETEEGQTIKSTIRVPMQPSWYIQAMLYELCEEINRIGGHALNKLVIQQLVVSLSEHIVEAYEKLLQSGSPTSSGGHPSQLLLSQTRSLQMLFDVKFLRSVLLRREESELTNKYQRRVSDIINKLESRVDPFDLDVFSPYIQSHLLRQGHRCQVLFGALTSLDKHSSYLTGPKPMSSHSQEQHNILPLATSHSRFPLLPLSTTTRSGLGSLMQPPKPKSMHPTPPPTPGSPPPMVPTPTEQPVSFLGTMSTIWFTKGK